MTSSKAKNEIPSHSVLRGTSIVGSITMLSRVLGFLRDLLMARILGAGLFSDAFFVAFRIPNILRSFVAEGALTSAFVPVFTDELNRGQSNARSTLQATCGLLLAVTLLLSGLGILFAPELVSLFAPGFKENIDKFEACRTLLQIMMPYIMFVSLVAMLNGALNSVHIFGAAAFAQVAMNLVMIAGIFLASFYDQDDRVYYIAWSVLVGGIAQILVQLPALNRSHFSLRPVLSFITPATKKILTLMIPAILGAAVYQVSLFIQTVFASLLQEGSVSWLFYADRLAQLPIGVFTVALSSVLLPTLSRAASSGDRDSFSEHLMNALRYTSFLLIPLAFGLYFLAEPLISLVFEHGAFHGHSSRMTAFALQALSLGVWGISCQMIFARAFIARKDTLTPALMGVLTLIVGVATSLLLMGPPTSSADSHFGVLVLRSQHFLALFLPLMEWKHVGLALSSAVASWFAVCCYLILLSREKISFRPFLHSSLKALMASSLMGASLFYSLPLLSSPLLQVVIGVPLGAVIYGLASLLLQSTEITEGKNLLSQKLRKLS
ncbi:MAG: murein biosynthesis integral membrane protein MurJ [Bdellovibrionales bacterium]|nr:murein biosynthesis integral membrane protein MurJ [Bdellovibrionales bacterium]